MKLLVLFIQLFDLRISGVIFRNVEWHQILSEVCTLLMMFKVNQQVVEDRIDNFALAVDKSVLPLCVEAVLV